MSHQTINTATDGGIRHQKMIRTLLIKPQDGVIKPYNSSSKSSIVRSMTSLLMKHFIEASQISLICMFGARLLNESAYFQRCSVLMSVYLTAMCFFLELLKTWCLRKRKSRSSK